MMDPQVLAWERIRALQAVTFPAGSTHKRFAREVAARRPAQLSPRQITHATFLAWRYRRQMPAHLVPPADPYANAPRAKDTAP